MANYTPANANFSSAAAGGPVYVPPPKPKIPASGPTQQFQSNPTNYKPAASSGGGGDSQLTQLQKVAQSGGLNPDQQRQLDELLSQQNIDNQISEAYGPALKALDEAIGVVQGGANTQQESVDRNYNSSVQAADTENASLTGQTENRQSDFKKTLKSAYEEAIRAYNALNQQRQARFGGGSSAAGAVGELANQEFFRQQGNIESEGVRGEREFASEFANINQYIAQKKTDLDNWRKDAIGKIQQSLQESLLAISMRRGDIEANKTRDKVAALQSAVQNVQAIQNTNTQFMQSLALNSIGQMQQVAGRAFSPTEIKAVLTQWGIPTPGVQSGGTQGGPQIVGNFGGKGTDDLFAGLTRV